MTSSLAVKIMTRLAMPPQKQRTCLWWRRKGKGGGKQNQTSWAHTMLCLWLRAARKQLWSRGGIEKRRGIWLKSGCWSESLLSASKVSESLHWRPLGHLWVVKNTFLLRGIKKKMERSVDRKVPLWTTEGSQQDSSVCYYMDFFPIRALLCFLHPSHDCKFLKGKYTANVCPPIIWTTPASFTSFKRERTWEQRPLKIWVMRKKIRCMSLRTHICKHDCACHPLYLLITGGISQSRRSPAPH